ncbi:hypothetical protein ACWCQ1_44660 [Streptomyces sp. NPDC002144]
MDNDIEIVGGNPDDTLVYDREVSIEGLRRRDLHAWWQEAPGGPAARLRPEGPYTNDS